MPSDGHARAAAHTRAQHPREYERQGRIGASCRSYSADSLVFRRWAHNGVMPKIALITGTSSGMGLHAAIALAKAGATVVATVRSLSLIHI